MRRCRRSVFFAVLLLLLSACGKDKPPAPPKPVESIKPASAEPAPARLNAAEPVVPAGIAALQTPPPVPALPPGASAADLQALRGEFEHQREGDKTVIEGLQSKLAEVEARLAKIEAKSTAANPVVDKPKNLRPKLSKNRRAALTPRHRVLPVMPTQAKPPQDETPPALPFYVGSVDTWDGEKQVMVRSGGQWHGLRTGETHQGWRIESADGQAVTLKSPQGRLWQVRAGQGG